MICKHVLLTVLTNQNMRSIHVIYFMTLHNLTGDTSQDEHEATLNLSKRFIIVRLSKTFHMQSDPHSPDWAQGAWWPVYVCICNWPLPIGAFQDQWNKQWYINIQINITKLRIPTGGRQTSWLFTSIAKRLNSGLPRTTSASGQNGIWTHDLPISNPAL